MRHSEGKTHKKRALSARSQTRLTFKSTIDPIHEKVTAAEVRNTVMIAHLMLYYVLLIYWSDATKKLPRLSDSQELSLCTNKNGMYFELCIGSSFEG